MMCSTPDCFGQGTWTARHPKDPKLTNVSLVVCVNCAIIGGKLGAKIRRTGEKG